VAVPSAAALNISGPVTYTAVIKPASLPAVGAIIDRGDDSAAAYGYVMVLLSTGQVRLTDSEFARTYASTTVGAVSAGTLYHIVLTSIPSGGAYVAYVNGAQNNTGVSSGAVPGGVASPLHIGVAVTRGTFVQPFPGLIDEAKKGQMDMEYSSGEELQTLMKELMNQPREVIERVKKILAD